MIAILCPSCNERPMRSFYKASSVPTNSCLLFETPEEAISYPCGEIDLGFCDLCGFVSNMAFEEKLTEYSGRYEETQGYSQTFQQFHTSLAKRLIEKYGLKNKRVLEIGCGKGEFLELLCKLGDVEGVGFDPGFQESRLKSPAMKRLKFVKDFYSEQYKEYKADFICCKMTLEHIHKTEEFIQTVRNAIGENLETVVFFQVPDAARILHDCAFEDIYYEHCSYFTADSIEGLFRRTGFDVLAVEKEYDNQYLTIESKPVPYLQSRQKQELNHKNIQSFASLVNTFPERCNAKLDGWRDKLASMQAAQDKVVLWGSGSKAVAFLTTLDAEGYIDYVVDINPHRQGHYMPKTAQKIVAPDFLASYQPDQVIIMNRIYANEISNDLEAIGLKPCLHLL